VDSLAIGFDNKINTAMHESNAVFTKDGKTMFFTEITIKKADAEKIKIKFPIYSCLELRGITENGQISFVTFLICLFNRTSSIKH
jgi:hypothetical protein